MCQSEAPPRSWRTAGAWVGNFILRPTAARAVRGGLGGKFARTCCQVGESPRRSKKEKLMRLGEGGEGGLCVGA